MATEAISYIKTVQSSGETASDIEVLVDAVNRITQQLIVLLAKLDDDAGVTDTNYEATINGTAPASLQTLSALQ